MGLKFGIKVRSRDLTGNNLHRTDSWFYSCIWLWVRSQRELEAIGRDQPEFLRIDSECERCYMLSHTSRRPGSDLALAVFGSRLVSRHLSNVIRTQLILCVSFKLLTIPLFINYQFSVDSSKNSHLCYLRRLYRILMLRRNSILTLIREEKEGLKGLKVCPEIIGGRVGAGTLVL